MKLKFLSITALLIAVGLATPVRADKVRQTNEQQMVQSSGEQNYNQTKEEKQLPCPLSCACNKC